MPRGGVNKIRLTGGEPLVRDDVEDIVAALRASEPTFEIALTTNGTRLAERAPALAAAGLSRVTVHLDSLQRDRVTTLMGRDKRDAMLAGIDAAKRVFAEVKLNVVVQKGKT